MPPKLQPDVRPEIFVQLKKDFSNNLFLKKPLIIQGIFQINRFLNREQKLNVIIIPRKWLKKCNEQKRSLTHSKKKSPDTFFCNYLPEKTIYKALKVQKLQ